MVTFILSEEAHPEMDRSGERLSGKSVSRHSSPNEYAVFLDFAIGQ